MKSLLNALQEGRLVELPETDKNKALQYLAHIIEAIPDLGGNPEMVEAIFARERGQNSGIGYGVACPHMRAPGEGELFCAVGWSPAGIDYGAPDSKAVHLVVMYYIPDSQKGNYLKEISALATAITKGGGIQPIAEAEELANVRERLLDWVSAAIDAALPEAKARMIRLEARQAAVEGAPLALAATLQVAPVLIVSLPERCVVLSSQGELTQALEKDPALTTLVQNRRQFDKAGFRLVFRAATAYDGRTLYEYIAVKNAAGA